MTGKEFENEIKPVLIIWKRLDDVTILGVWSEKLQEFRVNPTLKVLRAHLAEHGYTKAPTPNGVVAILKHMPDSRDDYLHSDEAGDHSDLYQLAQAHRMAIPQWRGRRDDEIGAAIDEQARLNVIRTREERPERNLPPWYDSILRDGLVHIYTGESWDYDTFADWHTRTHGRPPDWPDPDQCETQKEMLQHIFQKIKPGQAIANMIQASPQEALTKTLEQKKEKMEITKAAAMDEVPF